MLHIRHAFDCDASLLYFNSANLSLSPRSVCDAITRYHKEFEVNPTIGLANAWGKLWQVQQRLAKFLKASPSDLLLRTNITSVFNTFLFGLELKPNSEILIGEHEYGAIVNLCAHLAKKNQLRLRVIKMPQTPVAFRRLSPYSMTELVVSQLCRDTKVVVISHVIAGTGLVLPITQIAHETRQRDILLVVDGAYAPGALDINFETMDAIDFYGCSLYKWMLGPKGTAFGWVNPRHQDRLQSTTIGWTAFDTFYPFSAFGGGSMFQNRFVMSGCHDFAPFFAIQDTLDFWDKCPPEAIRTRIKHLATCIEKEVTEKLGWVPLRAPDTTLQSPMVTFRLPSRLWHIGPSLLSTVYEKLRIQINTVCLGQAWHIIFSPHIYNTEDEIHEAVTRLRSLSVVAGDKPCER